MRWPALLRRRYRGKHASHHRPGAWGNVAYPPPKQPADAPVGPEVRLGFADGTSVSFDHDSREAQAFRNAAARLTEHRR